MVFGSVKENDNQLCIIPEDKKWRGEQCRFPLLAEKLQTAPSNAGVIK
jgi:hypothetical protein